MKVLLVPLGEPVSLLTEAAPKLELSLSSAQIDGQERTVLRSVGKSVTV
ncbi:hypothetical protein [Pelobacter seleniigenes]|nr:hypothetical protein [Pelobacter seleniigenes]